MRYLQNVNPFNKTPVKNNQQTSIVYLPLKISMFEICLRCIKIKHQDICKYVTSYSGDFCPIAFKRKASRCSRCPQRKDGQRDAQKRTLICIAK